MYQRNHEAVTFRLVLQGRLGDAMTEVRNLERLSDSIGDVLDKTRYIKQELEKQKEKYALEEDAASELLKLTTVQHSALGGKLTEHNQLLKDTQGREENYQSLIKGNKARAAEIKSRIYELLDVGTQITFGEAVTIATWVDETIGVPASLLLAILTQESNLGKNVGTCNRLGDPPEKSWKVIMKPTRDQEPFKKITEELIEKKTDKRLYELNAMHPNTKERKEVETIRLVDVPKDLLQKFPEAIEVFEENGKVINIRALNKADVKLPREFKEVINEMYPDIVRSKVWWKVRNDHIGGENQSLRMYLSDK